MVATLIIEVTLAGFVFLRHHTTQFGRTAGVVLLLLSTFQLAEYRICTGPDDGVLAWARIGFVAITLLPISGLYLVSLISRKPHFLKLGYATACGFVLYFLFVPKAITKAVCAGNYVLFNTTTDLYVLYGIYYLGFLLLGSWEGIEQISNYQRQVPSKQVLQWLIVGYLSFMAPMAVLYITMPITRNATASIMCGFAVILALILALKVVPLYDRVRAAK